MGTGAARVFSETYEVGAALDAVPGARHFTVSALGRLGRTDVADAAELAVSELVTNALLHGAAPVRLEVRPADGEGVRIDVHDGSRDLPVRPRGELQGMTGRGLALVDALVSRWGIDPTPVGKVVWVELTADSADQEEPDADLDALLAGFGDWPEPTDVKRYTVTLGEVPTDLLLASKAHVESVVRELTLTASGAAAGLTAALPAHLAELVNSVSTEFSEARLAMKRQALAAAGRDEARTTLTLTLPKDAADAGERYLAALEEADRYARAARMLTLASPPQHQALRRWYVTALGESLRAAAEGRPFTPQSFEGYLLERVNELAELQEISQRGARLQQVTAQLAATLTVEGSAELALDAAQAALGATRCCFALTAPDGPRILAAHGYAPDVLDVLPARHLAGTALPAGTALSTGRSVWVETREERDKRFPQLVRVEPDVDATCAVPLRVGVRTLGVLWLSFPESRLFTADERAFLNALGAVTSQAMERAQLYESEARIADQLTRLQSVQASLAGARSLDEVLDVTIGHAIELVGARVASLNLLAEDGRIVTLARMEPAPTGPAAAWLTYSVDEEVPAAQVIRTGLPLTVATVAERNARWPVLSDIDPGTERTLTVLPLHVENTTVGALTLSFVPQQDLPDTDFLVAFADACAQALQRARAAERAVVATRRLTFLAQASAELAASLDVNRTLGSVARSAVPTIADWCAVHLLEHGELVPVAVEHSEPQVREMALGMQRRWPERLSDPTGVGRVVRTGETLYVPEMRERPTRGHPEGSELEQQLAALGLTSLLVVPLSARGRTLGSLSLLMAESGRRFDDDDRAFAEDLGRRAAVAIDNAGLFRELTTEAVARRFPRREERPPADALPNEPADIGRFDMDLAAGTVTADAVCARIYGFRPEAVPTLLADYLERVPGFTFEDLQDSLVEAGEHAGIYANEHRVVRPDGSVAWIAVRGQVRRGATGSLRLTGVAWETTAARQAHGELAHVLASMTDAFLRLDSDLRVTYVNPQAERLLFRRPEELLGRTIEEEFPAFATAVPALHQALRTGRQTVLEEFFPTLSRWLEIRAIPDAVGLSVFFHDVTARRAAEQDRITATDRLQLLVDASRHFIGSLDADEVLTQLAGVLVPRLGDWVVVTLFGPDGSIRRSVPLHADPERQPFLEQLIEQARDAFARSELAARVRRGEVIFRPTREVTPEARDAVGGQQALDALAALDSASIIAVPLQVGAETIGMLCVAADRRRRPFEQEDVATALDIARRASLALENARLYAGQRDAAELLQRSMLTPLPQPAGLELVGRYLAAGREAQVGGDWYDAFVQPDGATVVVIGDVVGHDLNAAAVMGQVRSLLRGIAYDRAQDPSVVLTRVDAALAGLAVDTLASAVLLRVERDDPEAGRWTLRWANAGHPPAAIVRADGSVHFAERDADLLLGLDTSMPRQDSTDVVGVGDTLLLYTDGLVERRDSPIEDGLARLGQSLGQLAGTPVEQLCDALLTDLLPANADDDVALLAVRFTGP